MLRVKEGDVAAFEELVIIHQDSVMGTVAKMLGSPNEAEDIAQQIGGSPVLVVQLGVGALIFTNLILLPILLSYVGVSPRAAATTLAAAKWPSSCQPTGRSTASRSRASSPRSVTKISRSII